MATVNVINKTYSTSASSSEDDQLILSTMKKRPRISKDNINGGIQESLTETTSVPTTSTTPMNKYYNYYRPQFGKKTIQPIENTDIAEHAVETQQEILQIYDTQLETIDEDPSVVIEEERQATDSPHSSNHSEDQYTHTENKYSHKANTGTVVALQSTKAAAAIGSTHGINLPPFQKSFNSFDASNHDCIKRIDLEDSVIDTFADYRKSIAPFADELGKLPEAAKISSWSFRTAAAVGVPPRNVEEPHLKSQQLLMELVKNHSLSTEIYDDLVYQYTQLDEDFKLLDRENKILQNELILKEDQFEFLTEELKEADDESTIYAAQLRKAERQIKRLKQALASEREANATLESRVKQLENANQAHVNYIIEVKKVLSSLQQGGEC